MKKIILSFFSLLAIGLTEAQAQVQIDKNVEMNGAANADRRVTGLANTQDVAATALFSDAVNIRTLQYDWLKYKQTTNNGANYALTLVPALGGYQAGTVIYFRAHKASPNNATINVNGLGARNLVKADGTNVTAGEIPLGLHVAAIYDGTNDRFQILSALPSAASPTTAWLLTGNAGTTPATNFLGTTDAQNLIFRTNNVQRIITTATGQVAVNLLTPAPSDLFSAGEVSGAGNASVGGYASASAFGVYGQNAGGDGTGLVGLSDNVAGLGVLGANLVNGIGVQGQATGDGVGVLGFNDDDAGNGVYALNIATRGTGLLAVGQNSIGYTLNNGSGLATNGNTLGGVAFGNSATATGFVAAGNDLAGTSLAAGSGGAFQGQQFGVFGNAAITGGGNNGVDRASFVGFYTSLSNTVSQVFVGARIGGTHYKILGTNGGSVSTTMETREGERILFAPEAPENWFFDVGEVTLVNGKARVQLDPLFYDCISKDKPFKVFVQGAENTLGAIRVSARGQDWFELEDIGGASNGNVFFNIYAIWKGKENLRLPKYEQSVQQIENEKKVATQGLEIEKRNVEMRQVPENSTIEIGE
ncbi:hypothetical protein [Hugenholtzia roseola]|uniref:hypothetical protein n=1 Tax=Hugenholtzia roseola TaxID=1002 RepID=UPI000400A61B|nr:hypothetical protein [Hugenholtzia roseola]